MNNLKKKKKKLIAATSARRAKRKLALGILEKKPSVKFRRDVKMSDEDLLSA